MINSTSGSILAITGLSTSPLGTNQQAAFKFAIIYLMIGQTLGSFLVPMIIAFFFFSTRALRRSFIFWCNVFALLVGIVQTVLCAYILVRRLYDCSLYCRAYILSLTDP